MAVAQTEVSQIASPPRSLFANSSSPATSNSASLDGARLCDGRATKATGEWRTIKDWEARAGLCENMQNESGLHSPQARGSGKNRSSPSIFDLIRLEKKARQENKNAAEQKAAENKWSLQKSIDFHVVLVSWKLSWGFYKWPLIQPRPL